MHFLKNPIINCLSNIVESRSYLDFVLIQISKGVENIILLQI